jgi:hypothetical protein
MNHRNNHETLWVGLLSDPKHSAAVDQWQREIEDWMSSANDEYIRKVIAAAHDVVCKASRNGWEVDEPKVVKVMTAYLAVYGWNTIVSNYHERKKLESEFKEDGK